MPDNNSTIQADYFTPDGQRQTGTFQAASRNGSPLTSLCIFDDKGRTSLVTHDQYREALQSYRNLSDNHRNILADQVQRARSKDHKGPDLFAKLDDAAKKTYQEALHKAGITQNYATVSAVVVDHTVNGGERFREKVFSVNGQHIPERDMGNITRVSRGMGANMYHIEGFLDAERRAGYKAKGGGVLLAAGVAGVILAAGGSKAEAATAFGTTAIPYGEAALAASHGDVRGAIRSIAVETGALLSGMLSGAAGGAVAGLPGMVAGGVAGAFGGSAVTDALAQKIGGLHEKFQAGIQAQAPGMTARIIEDTPSGSGAENIRDPALRAVAMAKRALEKALAAGDPQAVEVSKLALVEAAGTYAIGTLADNGTGERGDRALDRRLAQANEDMNFGKPRQQSAARPVQDVNLAALTGSSNTPRAAPPGANAQQTAQRPAAPAGPG